ncbi:terminase large subunit [Candidatus Pacearchaeota archaeon]|jgi:phage terminase large subunit-like protein|nr:terminase large subunit [Candidatus Pacearchaeota archaeon]
MKTKINPEAANQAIAFFKGLRHTTGQWAGEPFHLLDWQHKALIEIFGTLRPDGTRQYKNVYIEIPKKNGKSEFASGLALYLLTADGEPGAEVYSAATDRDQAGIVYRAARIMVEESPELSSRCNVLDGTKRIIVPRTNSFYRVLSSETYSKHGYNISGLVVDEVHAHKDRGLIDVLTKGSGAARRQPLFIFITTAGTDRNSICWEMHERALRILKFRHPKEYAWVQGAPLNDPSFYAVIYGLRDDEKTAGKPGKKIESWTLEKNWYKANPALGQILNIDEFRKAFEDAQRNLAEENLFKQLRLNIWVKSSVRWMRMSDWDACEEPAENLEGMDCYGGLDLSSTTDLSALALIFPRDGGFDVVMRYWTPSDTAADREKHDQVPYRQWERDEAIILTEGNRIDYEYVHQEINAVRQIYNLRELAYDPWNALQLVQELAKDGFTIDPKIEGIPLIPLRTGWYGPMSPPTKELMNQVLSKKLRHGGQPVLRWNADNTIVMQDNLGNIKPIKPKSAMRIDGIVALIMALDRATRHAPEEKSAFEDEGYDVKTF